MVLMNVNEIKKHPTFENMFPVNPKVLDQIGKDMEKREYDWSQPIILATWFGQNQPVCIDGHTRLQAAINAGIKEIPVFTHELGTEDEAVELCIHLQQARRNMTDAEIMTCIEELDKRRKRGGDRRSEEAKSKPQGCGIENSKTSSAKETAAKLGISARKVEQTRTVMDHADEETLKAVKKGEKSINKAYNDTQKKRKEKKEEEGSGQNKQTKKKQSASRKVEIDPGQWEELKKTAEMMDCSIDELIYEALEDYLYRDVDAESNDE